MSAQPDGVEIEWGAPTWFTCSCGTDEFWNDPMWRPATEFERDRVGWQRVPVFNPENSTCKRCGRIYVWREA